jgi:hypothetical protein
VGTAILTSGAEITPGVAGAVEVSWASRQNEHELNPSSCDALPAGAVVCQP